jgi:hypothetical protein
VNFTVVRKTVVPCMLGLLFCAASVSAQDSRAFYMTFNVEGSLKTSPTAINNLSTVTGTYTDSKGIHGFVREAFGKITSFDAPGSVGTNPTAINDDGMVVGTYTDSSQVSHGFLRNAKGDITRIDVTGSTGTELSGINAFGVIAGSAFTSGGSECFVRSPQGTITVFGPSRCLTAGINLFGAVTGIAGPSNTGGPPPPILVQGFVRSPKGVFTLFVAPGTSSNGTYSEYIDAFGGLAGSFQNSQDVSQNFLEPTPGNFITITPPGAYSAYITGLSELGAAIGYYNLSNGGTAHGFVRDLRGTVTSFDFPGSSTSPTGINVFGVITGSNGTSGILRVPY